MVFIFCFFNVFNKNLWLCLGVVKMYLCMIKFFVIEVVCFLIVSFLIFFVIFCLVILWNSLGIGLIRMFNSCFWFVD